MDSARFRTLIRLIDPSTNRHWNIDALVLRTIGIVTPAETSKAALTLVKDRLQGSLADPLFYEPRPIDIVLGADVYKRLMIPGIERRGSLLAQRTVFGWTLAGASDRDVVHRSSSSHACTSEPPHPVADTGYEQLLGLVQRFWETEDVPHVNRISAADRECEESYASGHSRDSNGRYIVPLPVKAAALDSLGDGLPQAHAALASLHRRMLRDPDLKTHYRRFMDEYLQLGHMRRVSSTELNQPSTPVHYIPHHGIWQKSDNERKLRVVFNASRPTATGRSLNDVLHAGPKLQSSIADVLSRWRRYKYVFCADVKMMFRQILVADHHVHLQRIIWSASADEPAEHHVLLTVTYGETCAPYLAIRTLKQLSADDGDQYPDAADAIERELYVDDFLSGGHDIPSAKRRRHQLITLLKAGGFVLKKWVANEALLLEDIPSEDRLRPSWMQFSTEGPVNELGVAWDPVKDQFKFLSPAIEVGTLLTKRRTLAELARVFDPLGWLAPLTLAAKFIIQDLWRAKLTWDEELPQVWADKWDTIRGSWSSVEGLVIPRWLEFKPDLSIQLHAFSDASRRAMAGVVYSRTTANDGRATISLLGAKTKLASIRSLQPPARAPPRMTIPRLELRAALIASRLLVTLSRALDVPLSDCHLWSDSRIVLSWVQSDKPIGNELVDNYVAQIHELSAGATWHHVPTNDNPSDIASRGADGSQLKSANLWWNGPHWLADDESCWPPLPTHAPTTEDDVAVQPPILCTATQTCSPTPHHIDRFSSLSSLLRGTVRARRLLRRNHGATLDPLPATMMPPTAAELRRAFIDCVKLTQAISFAKELAVLRSPSHDPLQHRALRPLTPFIDDDGVLRVGGRLTNSLLPYDERHLPILDGSTHLAKLTIRWAHERSLHSGFRATYAWTLHKAWIINAKVLVKRHLRECTICARVTARTATQGMAPLPAARVIAPSRPFERCGLDYAGPFQVLRSKRRGISSFKGYIALFVCLSTKAIHLELVGDLSTASFLGALTRFVGRRGRPAEIWSDNGTNFRGANHELQRLLKDAEMDWGLIKGQLAHEGVTWKFIPPFALHFGGLWEAGVKSTKMHLRRVVGPRRLTYEEFSTLLVSVEAILNSRPLAPPSGDLCDLDALTPSHFLIGTSVTSLPQPANPDINLEHSTHWDLVKGIRDRYWVRWSREYLNTLLQRPKWRRPQPNFEVDDFVVIVDASLLRPHGQWPMGRIIAVHPGTDGLVRTATGEYTRPIVKLARLPLTTSPADASPPIDSSAA